MPSQRAFISVKITQTMALYRIAVASFSHETLTFCPEPTDLEAWEGGGIKYGPNTLDTSMEGKTYITGFKEAVNGLEDVEFLGVLRTGWPKTTGYGSWISTEAFDVITSRITSRLEELGQIRTGHEYLHPGAYQRPARNARRTNSIARHGRFAPP